MATMAAEHFDLAVIGSGSGNSLIDERFADRRVALIDRGIGSTSAFGGTCLNVGCIPTKMFVHPADLAHTPAESSRLGVSLDPATVDWPQIRDRIFGRIDAISSGGRDWRLQNQNVTLFEGAAAFDDPRTLTITTDAGTEQITADQIVLANGSRPRPLALPGADQVAIHTSDDIMRLDALPESLLIIGGGFIAAEFAHVFAAYGVRVEIIGRSPQLLRREDADVSVRFTEILGQRIALHLGEEVTEVHPFRVTRNADIDVKEGMMDHTRGADGATHRHVGAAVLNATGRIPNSDTLNPQAAGLTVSNGLIVVDEHQRTSQPHILALGDVCSPWQLKHVANHEAKVVQHNLLHPQDLIRANHHAVPHAVFSHPQIASVGLTEAAAGEQFDDVVSVIQDYGSVAYGWALEDDQHFCKLVARADGTILGAHLIGPQASILIQPLIQAMATGLTAGRMAREQYWIHPALTELVENALLALPLEEADQ